MKSQHDKMCTSLRGELGTNLCDAARSGVGGGEALVEENAGVIVHTAW